MCDPVSLADSGGSLAFTSDFTDPAAPGTPTSQNV